VAASIGDVVVALSRLPAHPRHLVAAGLVVAQLVLSAGFAFASPEDWERLPDGRVIIQVKDVRFALPSQGADTQLIRFTDRLQIKNEMTLEQVIKAPAAARRMFAKTSLMNVSLPNLLERSDPFLSGFPRNDFRSFEAGFAIGKGALADCADWANTFAQLAASLVPGDARIGSSGWEEFKLSEHPLTSAYVRHPWSRPTFFPRRNVQLLQGLRFNEMPGG
jgi:hypothetical protein